jgi:hypothetical protein
VAWCSWRRVNVRRREPGWSAGDRREADARMPVTTAKPPARYRAIGGTRRAALLYRATPPPGHPCSCTISPHLACRQFPWTSSRARSHTPSSADADSSIFIHWEPPKAHRGCTTRCRPEPLDHVGRGRASCLRAGLRSGRPLLPSDLVGFGTGLLFRHNHQMTAVLQHSPLRGVSRRPSSRS